MVTDLSGATIVVAATGGAAHRAVALLCVQTVGRGGADGHAGAKCAHEARRTVRIDVARGGFADTSNVRCWVGDEAVGAGTLRPVVADGAEGVGATHRGGAAGVGAAVVDARLIAGAVLVGAAADHADVAKTDVTQETVVVEAASHCGENKTIKLVNSNRHRAICAANKVASWPASRRGLLTHAGAADTLLVPGTVVVASTAKVTHAILTSEARRTVAVPLASRWHPEALHISLSGEVWRAGAFLPVVHHLADGVEATRLLLSTQIGALSTHTRLRQPTLGVTLAWR